MPSATPTDIRILLVDDHELVRTGLRLLIEHQAHMTVVGEATDWKTAVALAAQETPDIVLLDLDLAGASSIDGIAALLDAAPASRVVIVTGVISADEHMRAVQNGAVGVVRKEQAAKTLIAAIERVSAGEVWLDPSLVARVLGGKSRQQASRAAEDLQAQKIARLTPREREVIALVGEGLHNRLIATRLCISEATVSHHLTSIFAKLELRNRFDLVVYAYRHGLAAPPR